MAGPAFGDGIRPGIPLVPSGKPRSAATVKAPTGKPFAKGPVSKPTLSDRKDSAYMNRK